MAFKTLVKKAPLLRNFAAKVKYAFDSITFSSSSAYWEDRYKKGGNSGVGSYGELGKFKAQVLNSFVKENRIETVIEFGCGDGVQLSLAKYPRYIGLDISKTALYLCRNRFQNDITKSFYLYDPHCWVDNHGIFRARLAISLDVIYHLVEDEIYIKYMEHFFRAAEQYIIIYSSNHEQKGLSIHVRHRRFTDLINKQFPSWHLIKEIENPYRYQAFDDSTSCADFYIFKKT